MATLRLTVETLTPLLMYGADQDEPELRGASFRGILRYWLRAVLGAKHTNSNTLYKEESKLLGSTEQGSKVTIHIAKSRSMEAEDDQWVLPERTSKGWRARYNAFPPGSGFRITLSTHPLDGSGILAGNSDLVKALFLMTHIGGLGRRARRGSGNLSVLEAKGYSGDLDIAYLADNRDDLAAHLQKVGEFVNENTTVGHRPPFATFAPDTCVILLGKRASPTVDDVLGNNGDLWRVSGPYHHAGGIFGDVRPRRASAVHMRVAVTREGYVPQQTIFYAGNGAWDKMIGYINSCFGDFDMVYGGNHWRNWR